MIFFWLSALWCSHLAVVQPLSFGVPYCSLCFLIYSYICCLPIWVWVDRYRYWFLWFSCWMGLLFLCLFPLLFLAWMAKGSGDCLPVKWRRVVSAEDCEFGCLDPAYGPVLLTGLFFSCAYGVCSFNWCFCLCLWSLLFQKNVWLPVPVLAIDAGGACVSGGQWFQRGWLFRGGAFG